tara:strand:- start:433 stop:1092 length:660 start_codon:yes stop_codon:yes gene_type:complete
MSNFNKISGMIVFCNMAESIKAYIKPGTPPKPNEWKCSVVLTDEDYVDELEAYGKSLDTLLSMKKVKAVDFEATYKVPPPKDAGKNVWIMTLRKSTELGKTGKPVPIQYEPKVFEKIGNTMLEITSMKLVANGSYGTMSIDRFDRSNGGSSLYLKNLLVTDLIEYVKQESEYEAGSEFSDDEDTPPVTKAAAKAPAPVKAPAKAKVKAADEDEDFDIPF